MNQKANLSNSVLCSCSLIALTSVSAAPKSINLSLSSPLPPERFVIAMSPWVTTSGADMCMFMLAKTKSQTPRLSSVFFRTSAPGPVAKFRTTDNARKISSRFLICSRVALRTFSHIFISWSFILRSSDPIVMLSAMQHANVNISALSACASIMVLTDSDNPFASNSFFRPSARSPSVRKNISQETCFKTCMLFKLLGMVFMMKSLNPSLWRALVLY
mmetsp:Transcript_47081/g.64103  ORF Transcript_47081/g.64103 Transcript_47081/m.64103 type:complete len:217 (+) Transcript_47081:466-1116(+)